MIHPGSLSALCWKRLAKHLPAGVALRVLELEAINAYWEQDTELTVDTLADRLKWDPLESTCRHASLSIL